MFFKSYLKLDLVGLVSNTLESTIYLGACKVIKYKIRDSYNPQEVGLG